MRSAILFLFVICSCKSADEKNVQPKQDSSRIAPLIDSVTPPPLALPTDHASNVRYIQSRLKRGIRKGKSEMDSVFNEYSGKIIFEVGPLFTRKRTHAVVNVHDGNDNPIYVFEKNSNDWKLIHQLSEIYNPGDYPVVFRDVNFDGYKDLLIKWFFMAGRCNCSADGCLNVYLYNPSINRLVENKEIPGYLDAHIVDSEKAIYLGEHCNGIYRKFRWNKMEMVLVESYEFMPDECWQTDEGPCSLVHRVHRNGMIFEDTIQDKELPGRWMKIFHGD